MKRRYRRPPQREGRISFWYGRDEAGDMGQCFQWGTGASKRDANFIANALYFEKGIPGSEGNRTFVKELEHRGYDLTTLRFSIDKKKEIP